VSHAWILQLWNFFYSMTTTVPTTLYFNFQCLGKRLEYAESTKKKYRSMMKLRLVPGIEIRIPFSIRPCSSRQSEMPAKRLTSEEKHISSRVSRTGRERSDSHGRPNTRRVPRTRPGRAIAVATDGFDDVRE